MCKLALLALVCFGSVICGVHSSFWHTNEKHDESVIIDTYRTGIMEPNLEYFNRYEDGYRAIPLKRASGTECKIGEMLKHVDRCNKCECIDGSLRNLRCTNELCKTGLRLPFRKNSVCNIMVTLPLGQGCEECTCLDGRASNMDCHKTDCIWNYGVLRKSRSGSNEGYHGGQTTATCNIFTTIQHRDGCRTCMCMDGHVVSSVCNENNCKKKCSKSKKERIPNTSCSIFSTYNQYGGCNRCKCNDGVFKNMRCEERKCDSSANSCAIFTTYGPTKDPCTRCVCGTNPEDHSCIKNACKASEGNRTPAPGSKKKKMCELLTSVITPDGCRRCLCLRPHSVTYSCARSFNCTGSKNDDPFIVGTLGSLKKHHF